MCCWPRFFHVYMYIPAIYPCARDAWAVLPACSHARGLGFLPLHAFRARAHVQDSYYDPTRDVTNFELKPLQECRSLLGDDDGAGDNHKPLPPPSMKPELIRVRFHIIRNARIKNVGKSQSCMVSKLRIIWKQTVGDVYSLVEACPKTGRTHQIRAHMAAINHPLVCDAKYKRKLGKRQLKWYLISHARMIM